MGGSGVGNAGVTLDDAEQRYRNLSKNRDSSLCSITVKEIFLTLIVDLPYFRPPLRRESFENMIARQWQPIRGQSFNLTNSVSAPSNAKPA